MSSMAAAWYPDSTKAAWAASRSWARRAERGMRWPGWRAAASACGSARSDIRASLVRDPAGDSGADATVRADNKSHNNSRPPAATRLDPTAGQRCGYDRQFLLPQIG